MNFAAIEAAKKGTKPGNLTPSNELRLRETHPEVRSWNLSVEEIRREGALVNLYKGTVFSGIDVPMVLVLWPGYGVRSAGFHYGYMPPGAEAATHTHPVSDECIVNWIGGNQVYLDGTWVETGPLDVVLAPCGVAHGGCVPAEATASFFPGGFAAPPQLDLYLRTPYVEDGKFQEPAWGTLEVT